MKKTKRRPRATPHESPRDARGQGLLWSSRCPCSRCVFHRAALWLAQRLADPLRSHDRQSKERPARGAGSAAR